MYNEIFHKIDTTSFKSFAETSRMVVERLANDIDLVISLLDAPLSDEKLLMKSECYDFLDKIVCYSDDESGVSMRVSLFNDKYANRIHYHRWDYCACVLSGMYEQSIYGIYDGIEITELYPYDPLIIENIGPKASYVLDHRIIHSISAVPNTVSICVRGPAYYDSFQAVDPRTNSSWIQYGAKFEAAEEKEMKRISPNILNQRIDYIKSILSK